MFLQVFVLFMFGTAFTILIAHDPRFEQERLELNAQDSELSLEEFEIVCKICPMVHQDEYVNSSLFLHFSWLNKYLSGLERFQGRCSLFSNA